MSDPAAIFAAALTGLAAMIQPIQEAVIGYRTRLIEMGMGAEAADRCAADYHAFLLAQFPGPKARK